MLAELRVTIGAVEQMYSYCTRYLNLREQHVDQMMERYGQRKLQVHAAFDALRAGEFNGPFVADIDMQTMDFSNPRLRSLEVALMENLSQSGRIKPLMNTLAACDDDLTAMLARRQELVLKFQNPTMTAHEKVARVYGLPLPNGQGVDNTYGDVVSSIFTSAKDCSHLSKMLHTDLYEHGIKLRKAYARRYRAKAPMLPNVDWSPAEAKGFFADESDAVKSWRTNYYKRVPPTEGRRGARVRFSVRRRFRALTGGSALRYWLRTKLSRSKGKS